MIAILLGCVDPPTLNRVAAALAAEAVAEASPAIGLFLSVGSLVAEPCTADNVDEFVFSGEGAIALGVTVAEVTINETTNERTWNFGTVAFADDTGSLVMRTDATRTGFAVVYSGEVSSLNAELDVTGCTDGGNDVADRASVSGEGHYSRDDSTTALSIEGDASERALAWEPSNATLPSDGFVEWTSSDEEVLIALDPAADIEASTRVWPGLASDEGAWQARVEILIP